MRPVRFDVVQIGCRRNYLVPSSFEKHGMLNSFFTDFCLAGFAGRAARSVGSVGLQRLLPRVFARVLDSVPSRKVYAHPVSGIGFRLLRPKIAGSSEWDDSVIKISRVLAESYRRNRRPGADFVYGFDDASVELFNYAKSEGLKTIMDQCIYPKALLTKLLRDEERRFPEWCVSTARSDVYPKLEERARAEWNLADCIIAGSEFVRDGLIESGVSPEKIVTVPYGTTISPENRDKVSSGKGRLRVATVGTQGIRKGTPWFYEVARRSDGQHEFSAIGEVDDLPADRQRELAKVCQVHGRVPRTEMKRLWESLDVLFLPTVAEGSAAVCYEAMANGLIVITTPGAGSIISNETDGYLRERWDTEGVISLLDRLSKDPELRMEIGRRAKAAVRETSGTSFGARLKSALLAEP